MANRLRRSRRRRSSASRPSDRRYSLEYLLSRQPKAIRAYPDYPYLVSRLAASPALQGLRFGRRCYSLLQRATVLPANLHFFFRTYRLPDDPFFPLFFSIKRRYLADRENTLKERRRYILDAMRSLEPSILSYVKYVGFLERSYHSAGRSPVWQRSMMPRSKRGADRLVKLDRNGWAGLLDQHLALLETTYAAMKPPIRARIVACYLLEIDPPGIPAARPSREVVSRAYRRLSLVHHPDRGGDPARFIALKRARDILSE